MSLSPRSPRIVTKKFFFSQSTTIFLITKKFFLQSSKVLSGHELYQYLHCQEKQGGSKDCNHEYRSTQAGGSYGTQEHALETPKDVFLFGRGRLNCFSTFMWWLNLDYIISYRINLMVGKICKNIRYVSYGGQNSQVVGRTCLAF